jgi:Recombination endonuclease VII
MKSVCVVEGCLHPSRTYGLCVKHYEEHLRAKMGPCTYAGCDKQARSKGLCNTHYRAEIAKNKPKCRVENCGRPVVSGDLCDTHRLRLQHHGHLDFTRPEDWGSRSKHPLMQTWKWLSRKGLLCEEWKDFWRFVSVVKERPSPRHRLRRKTDTKLCGEDNWEWRETAPSVEKANYQKQWRVLNPDKARNNELRYGIGVDEYAQMLAKQNGVCAICHRDEKTLNLEGTKPRRLAVDHCHATGKVRGLLCTTCNTMVGSSRDRVDLLESAIAYLQLYVSYAV